MNLRHLPALLTAFFLLACAPLTGPKQALTHHVLLDAPAPAAALDPAGPSLLLRDLEAPAFYQDPRLAFSLQTGTRGHYQYAAWHEAPARRLRALLLTRLAAAGRFSAVRPIGEGVAGDLQLSVRLSDFYHAAGTAPGEVVVALDLALVRRDSGRLLGSTHLVARAPAPDYSAAGAARAFDVATRQALDQATAWIGALARTPDARKRAGPAGLE